MEYLFDVWEKVKTKVDESSSVVLFLDYDGTLTPIAERPELALLPTETRELLREISSLKKYVVCIVSGRSLEDVKRLVGIGGIYYVGNHGLEAEGPRISMVNLQALNTESIIAELHKKLSDELKHIKGVLVEDKTITLAVHYRLVKDEDVAEVRDIFSRIVQPYVLESGVKTAENKKTLEILPDVGWDKGRMVVNILNLLGYNAPLQGKIEWSPIHGMIPCQALTRPNVLQMYIGDDRTDEDAFNALGECGVSVLVSEEAIESHAGYYVKNVGEVVRVLKMLGGRDGGG